MSKNQSVPVCRDTNKPITYVKCTMAAMAAHIASGKAIDFLCPHCDSAMHMDEEEAAQVLKAATV
jgi:hypothetical protein